jgi:hypothetical protein
MVNPKTLEWEVAKEILSWLFDFRALEVGEMVRLRIRKNALRQEFSLSL